VTITPEAAAVGMAQLPVETLRGLHLDGDVGVGSLAMSGLELSEVKLTIKARDGRIALNPVVASLYDGKYRGAVGVDATGKVPHVSIDSDASGIDVESLFQALQGETKLTGVAQVNIKLTGTGADFAAIKGSLRGEGRFSLRDGEFRGVNVADILHQADALVGGHAPPEREGPAITRFSVAEGTLQMADGVAVNRDLHVGAPDLEVTGEGSVDLRASSVDYMIQASLPRVAGMQGGRALRGIAGIRVPVAVRGPFNDLRVRPDFAGLAAAAVEQQVEKQIDRGLKKLLGVPKEEPAAAVPSAPGATGQAPPPVKKRSAEEELINQAVKGLLKF
jgi:AsmA protein